MIVATTLNVMILFSEPHLASQLLLSTVARELHESPNTLCVPKNIDIVIRYRGHKMTLIFVKCLSIIKKSCVIKLNSKMRIVDDLIRAPIPLISTRNLIFWTLFGDQIKR